MTSDGADPEGDHDVSRGRPRLVMMVSNRVTGDSRVEKTARSAMEAGYEVVVLGVARRAPVGADLVGDVLVDRLPLNAPLTLWSNRQSDRAHLSDRERARRAAAAQRAWVRRAWTRSGVRRSRVARAGSLAERAYGRLAPTTRLLRLLHRTRGRLAAWTRGVLATRDWRRGYPFFADLEAEMGRAAVALRPDVIHAHDVHVMGAAHLAHRLLAARGHHCPWVYDAHEWVTGIPADDRPKVLASRTLEAALVEEADEVVTVSAGLAELLEGRYRLRRPVTVVENATSRRREGPPPGRAAMREEIGLDEDVPLLVYAGGVHPRRGLGTVVEALPALPGVHLALVAEETPALRRPLREQARTLGVDDRVHFLDYVPTRNVTWYLSGADVGLIPIWRTPSHDSARPTKVGEYLQAGLPMVSSDTTATARFLTETGVGEVFTDRDPSSFARAVQQVLSDLPRYQAAITPEVLDELSWERSEQALLGVYARLLGERAPAPPALAAEDAAQDGAETVIHVFGVDESQWAATWSRAVEDAGPLACEVLPPASAVDRDRWLALQHFRRVASTRRLLVESAQPVLAGVGTGHEAVDLTMLAERGVTVTAVLHGEDARDVARHATRVPWSRYATLDDDQLAELAFHAGRGRSRARDHHETTLLVEAPDLLDAFPRAQWCPPVVPDAVAWSDPADPLEGGWPTPPADDTARPLRVAVAMADREPAARAAGAVLDRLAGRLAGREVVWRRVDRLGGECGPGTPVGRALRSADVVVTDLDGIVGTEAAAALLAGAEVVCAATGHRAAARLRDVPGVHVGSVRTLRTTLEELVPLLDGDPTARRHLVRSAAADVFGGPATARAVARALDVRTAP